MSKIDLNIATQHEQSKENSLFSFKKLSQRFFWSLKWNTFESLLYHAIFITHQWGMFTLSDPTVYGALGAIFAFSYLMVTLLMIGFDTALMPWIVEWTQDKFSYRKLLKYHIIPHVIFYSTAPFILKALFFIPWINKTYSYIEPYSFVIGLFITIEGIKKLLRHFLQLLFMNRFTAFMEVGGITLFCLLVWGWYLMFDTFSINSVLVSFIASSAFGTTCMFLAMKYSYKKLPNRLDVALPLPSYKEIWKVQFMCLINQGTRSLFSTNVLIPLSVSISSYLQVRTLTFFNYISHTCTFFIYKICAPSAAAFFGRTTHYRNDQKKSLFLVMKLLGALIVIACLSIIAACWYIKTTRSFEIMLILLLLLLSHSVENLFIMYEKFLVAQKKLSFLFILNLIQLVLTVVVMQQKLIFFTESSPLYIIFWGLFCCFSIRLFLFFIATVYLFMSKK